MDERIITLFGTGRAKAGEPAYEQAYLVGRALASAGITIANGGYTGTMLAAARGAADAGGQVIGVTCSAFKARPNQYITRQIVTESLPERLAKLIQLGQGYIVLPGGTGTLLELAMVWELKNKGFLQGDKPIILVGGFWKPLVDIVARDDASSSRYLTPADGPEQAAKMIIERLGARSRQNG